MSQSLSFKFHIRDAKNAMSHFMLNDWPLCEKIIAARKASGVESLEYTATVFIDGIQVDANVIEKEIQRWYKGLEEGIRKEFTPEGFEARVEAEVQKRIKERADGVIEILDSLREKLENADELIKPHWEE